MTFKMQSNNEIKNRIETQHADNEPIRNARNSTLIAMRGGSGRILPADDDTGRLFAFWWAAHAVSVFPLVKMPPAFSLTVRVPIVPGMAEGTFPNIVFHTMP